METRLPIEPVRSYRDLVAWQLSVRLAVAVHRAANRFPTAQRFGLIAQLQRAAVSVASNIAEGHGQFSRRGYLSYLGIARGSLKEVETQLEIAHQLGFMNDANHSELQELCDRISRLLTNLKRALANRH